MQLHMVKLKAKQEVKQPTLERQKAVLMQLHMVKLKAKQETKQPTLERRKAVLMQLHMVKLKAKQETKQPTLERQKANLIPLLMVKRRMLQRLAPMDRQYKKRVILLMVNKLTLLMRDHMNFMHMVTLVLLPPRNLSESKEILNSLTYMI